MFRKTAEYRKDNPDNYLWVKNLHQLWRIKLISIVQWSFLIILVAIVPLLILMIWYAWAKWALIMAWSYSLVLGFVIELLIITISCPTCGYNPARSRRTDKTINTNQVNDRLLKLEQCPVCEQAQQKKS